MFIDFHSHILPGVDDGSRSVEESVAILDRMAEDSVDIVVATPHYYCHDMSAKRFLEKRREGFEKLKPHLKPEHPRILLGAEVLYSSTLADNKYLDEMCIEGTDFLLLEMPYDKLTDKIIDGVDELSDSKYKLLIAHIERYLSFTSYKDLEKLMSLDVLGQLNSKSFENRKKRKYCLKLIKENYAHVLGTDFHRIDRGDLPLSYGYDVIAKKLSDEACDRFLHNSEMLVKNSEISDISGR